MANLSDRLALNVAGRYYVDSSCIDCDQCRVAAPDYFGRDADSGMSFVSRQPETQEGIDQVEQAIAECATASIGNDAV